MDDYLGKLHDHVTTDCVLLEGWFQRYMVRVCELDQFVFICYWDGLYMTLYTWHNIILCNFVCRLCDSLIIANHHTVTSLWIIPCVFRSISLQNRNISCWSGTFSLYACAQLRLPCCHFGRGAIFPFYEGGIAKEKTAAFVVDVQLIVEYLVICYVWASVSWQREIGLASAVRVASGRVASELFAVLFWKEHRERANCRWTWLQSSTKNNVSVWRAVRTY